MSTPVPFLALEVGVLIRPGPMLRRKLRAGIAKEGY